MKVRLVGQGRDVFAQFIHIERLFGLFEVQPFGFCRQASEPVQQTGHIGPIHHRAAPFIASVIFTVSTLTVVTQASRSTTFSLWSAKR